MPRILLFGAGSVGAVYVYILQQGGAEVTAVCRSNYEAVRAHGFTIKSNMFGDVLVKPQVVRSPSDAHGTFDYVVICSKAMPGVKPSGAELIKPAVGPKTGIVIVQNGIGNEEEYAEIFPDNPIISGVVYLPATQVSPGVVVHQEVKLLHLGTFPATAHPAHKASVAEFAALVKAGGGDVEVHEDVQRERWSKLMVNAAWNPTCALTRSRDAEYLRSSPGAADVVQNVMLEVAGIAQAAGYKDIDATKVEKQINRAKVRPFPGVLPSMAQDILEGRALEVEAILGNTIRIARNYHMKTPLLDTLYAFAKGLDAAGERGRESKD